LTLTVVTRVDHLAYLPPGASRQGLRRAKGCRTGQNRAVHSNGCDRNPFAPAFAMTIASVERALGNAVARP
jgi:hypothetical protein